MAILEPLLADSPLSQGDILKGVQLFASRKSPDALAHTAIPAKHDLCLILSRQCVIAHKQSLVVAAVGKYVENIPIDLSFDEVVDFFTTTRDGVNTPDLFYLGNLPDETGRFCARLDSVHTIELPPKPDDRRTYVREHRIARLNSDYSRDLHMRIFGAFASMGFEDYEWLSTADLTILVEKGKSEIASLQDAHRMTSLIKSTASQPTDLKQEAQGQKTIDTLRKKLEPYERLLENRQSKPPEIKAQTE